MLVKKENPFLWIKKDWLLTFLLIAAVGFSKLSLAQQIINHTKSNDPKETLVLNVLKLAIEKSGNANNYTYQESSTALTEARMVEMVKEGSLSVMWAGTQIRYEQELLPIRIPVLKGLLGHRIFIIRQGEQHQFDQINSFQDLQRIPLGQGRFWGDTAVLKHNKMNVVAPVKYESLFHMLEGGRFDFYPRAVHEPWSEVTSRAELNLTVEKRILLIYPFAMYFFVSRDNPELGQTIESGFRRAIDDGSFDKLFFAHPLIQEALQKSGLKNRLVFRLENPNMTPETPSNDKSLWLNLDEL